MIGAVVAPKIGLLGMLLATTILMFTGCSQYDHPPMPKKPNVQRRAMTQYMVSANSFEVVSIVSDDKSDTEATVHLSTAKDGHTFRSASASIPIEAFEELWQTMVAASAAYKTNTVDQSRLVFVGYALEFRDETGYDVRSWISYFELDERDVMLSTFDYSHMYQEALARSESWIEMALPKNDVANARRTLDWIREMRAGSTQPWPIDTSPYEAFQHPPPRPW
jgi:hypothetical protein